MARKARPSGRVKKRRTLRSNPMRSEPATLAGCAHRVRRASDYALTVSDPHPHLECGGPEGGLVFIDNHSSDGQLYDRFDEHGKLVLNSYDGAAGRRLSGEHLRTA